MRTAILPGTYDPITCGHTSLAVRAAALFGRAVVVVMNNTEKRTLFSFDQRLELARRVSGQDGYRGRRLRRAAG